MYVMLSVPNYGNYINGGATTLVIANAMPRPESEQPDNRAPGAHDFGVPIETGSGFGGLKWIRAGAENPQNLLPEVPIVESAQNLRTLLQTPANDSKEVRRAVWEATGCVPRIAGGAPNNSTKQKNLNKDPNQQDESQKQHGGILRKRETGVIECCFPAFSIETILNLLKEGHITPEEAQEAFQELGYDSHEEFNLPYK
jgi:hypothetical protein